MKKILVTTDFSANSKAALRFAIQLAAQSKAILMFLHVQNVVRPTAWNASTYASYEKHELTKSQENLVRFVDSVYKAMKVSPQTHACVIQNSPFVDSTLINYAADHGSDFICISTRGAGMIEKLFGTTTAKPSMLHMFTRQNEGFFKRLFLSGKSIDCSFLTTVPLLVFRKA